MTDDCGDYGGTTEAGNPCGRPAGWGTDLQTGKCREHAEAFKVPRKLDETTKNQILGAAQKGAMLKHCAEIGGITARTLRTWLSDGEEHVENGMETPLGEFYLRFQRARAAGAVERLGNASDEFVLSASYGYNKTERREHAGDAESPIELVINDSIREVTEE